jgi:hypothetical protein
MVLSENILIIVEILLPERLHGHECMCCEIINMLYLMMKEDSEIEVPNPCPCIGTGITKN